MTQITRLVLQRLALGFVTLLIVSVLIFWSVELLPGDAAQEILGQSATPETVTALRHHLGLDQPPMTRYAHWLQGITHGDFGTSIANGRPVLQLITGRLGNTLFLAAFAGIIAVPLALMLGIMAALLRNSFFDRAAGIFTLTAISFPEFFVAYILTLFLSVKLGLFPSISNITPSTDLAERVYRSFLPALALTLAITAHIMRMTRAALINLFSLPYIEMARLKGASPGRVVMVHALRNALAPIVNVVVLNLAYLITGVVIVEVVFVYPGVGRLLVDSVSKRDLPVVQAICLIVSITYILLNLFADIVSIVSNPRLMHAK
ncbi:ABC transporter permease [Mesorhizobium sp. LNHC252B00]|uniref:ABC transporter permease n=1 Tax=Mesorhizobium sp. LNHC252B00 TaxID=1287252 RepID=UPI0003CE6BF9|nr:ABC transporter permease [Mesorhizobium sp. LNHC252B00]ESY64905.1 ABC transporter permease [Mesorhizobium sp. LNHC252B00]